MRASFTRIAAMVARYLYLHKRSVSRTLEIFFWPVMELFVWGFLALYVRQIVATPAQANILFLVNALIFWDLLYRSQQGVTISFVEEIWTQNIINLLISPLRLWEWLAATFFYGLCKILVITALLGSLAFGLYQFNLIGTQGFYLIPLMGNLLLFGWALGVFTSGLLMRWGHAVEALIWGVPFLVQPISAIYYPLSTLPSFVQKIALCLPSTHVFEGMREVVATGRLSFWRVGVSFGLNLIYFILASAFFIALYRKSRDKGRLGRLGLD